MAMTISKRNTILSVLLTFVTVWSLNAQSIDGKVISSKGGEPVPFANILVKGSTIGVATDMNGEFAITIPSESKNGALIISAVGFSNKEFPISDLAENRVNIFTIKTQEYNIDEVDVEAVSRVLYGAVKKCSSNIDKNYITNPYSCDFTYSNNEKTAQGIMTDITGYQRTTFKGSYRKIQYQFATDHNKEVNAPYFDGRTNMEDLLSFDLVRTVGNVIDEQNVYDFDLTLAPKNQDPDIWVIHFAAKEPKLYNTGDAYATNYEGELYITKANFAVVKAVVRGSSSQRSIHGKSIMVSEKSSAASTNHNYEATCTYKAVNGKYRMDKIEMTESFTDAHGQAQNVKSSIVIDQQKENVEKLKGRDYYAKSL